MKASIVSLCALFLLCCLSGCGSKADSLMKDRIKVMNELADAVDKDQPIGKLLENLADIDSKLRDLKLSDSDKEKLFEKHKDELMKSSNRLQKAYSEKGLKVPGELGNALAALSSRAEADADSPAATRPDETQRKPIHDDERNPVPLDKWDAKYLESIYPIKLMTVKYNGGVFTLTFQFTKDDTEGLFKKDEMMKGKIYFFDADNVVATRGSIELETPATGKKGEGFRCIVQLDGGFDSARLAKRAEVREK